MKRKIIIGMIFCIILILNSYKVQAYSGEIDPKEYITLPSTIVIIFHIKRMIFQKVHLQV